MKTKIYNSNFGRVTIEFDCAYTGERLSRTFYSSGTYVRDDETGKQVCAGLSSVGYTLMATPDQLLDVVRSAYRQMRREEARELAA